LIIDDTYVLKDKLIKLYENYEKNKYEIFKLFFEIFNNKIHNKYYNEDLDKIVTYAEICVLNNKNLKLQLHNIAGVADKRVSEIKTWTLEDVKNYVKFKNKQIENQKSKQNGRVNEH